MMDSELKKTSVRANTLEKKRFEMMMSAFDSAKRNVAVDMKKSQLDFKRRLKRYKDRQREILVTRSEPSSNTVEEFILKQLRRRTQLNHFQQLGPRPQTSPYSKGNYSLSSGSLVTGTSSSGVGPSSLDFEDDEDFHKLSHCRRSKVDLRPCTAWSEVRNSTKATASRPSPSGVRLLQLRGGSLGTPARQVRYLDDEEIAERSTFYRFLLEGFRNMELQRLETLNDRVDEFCGKVTNKPVSCPPIMNVNVVSLPSGVPPIIHQAMRVRVPPMAAPGHLRRARTQ